MRAVYPDARLVFVHRDALHVLLSVARLTEVLRRPFTRHVDRAALGRQELARWSQGARLMVEAADETGFAEPIAHLHYRDLVGDPLAAVEALYRHFGLGLGPAAAARIGRMVEANPNSGYAPRRDALETYRIDFAAARERFAPYMARFGISPEAQPPSHRRPLQAAASPSPGF